MVKTPTSVVGADIGGGVLEGNGRRRRGNPSAHKVGVLGLIEACLHGKINREPPILSIFPNLPLSRTRSLPWGTLDKPLDFVNSPGSNLAWSSYFACDLTENTGLRGRFLPEKER